MKKAIKTDKAPAALGPYSQAVMAGDFLFVSGQIPIDPDTGQIVPGDITAQTGRVMENLKAILTSVGLGFPDIVKTTIFLSDMSDFKKVNETYGGYFGDDPPARATIEVARLPLDVQVEIECVAYKG